MKKEVEDRKKAKEINEEKRRKLIEEKKIKQEAILRAEQEKSEKKLKKRMLEERWAMARWISKYIDENTEKWKREKINRQEDDKKRAEEWRKMERLEKFRVLTEKI